MKKLSLGALGALIIAVVTASFVGASGLYIANDSGDARVAADQTVDGSAYLAGQNVIVEGTVKGDVYCAGSSVTIQGTVEGDVLCAAATNVTVNGTVNGDVRVAGSEVVVKGQVAGSVTAAGSSVYIVENAKVGRDLTGGAATLTIDGEVGRDVLAGAETANINGMIGRDFNAGVTNIVFGSRAKINGNLDYTGEREQSVPNGVVTGAVHFKKAETKASTDGSADITGWLFTIFSLAVLTVLVVLVAPRFVHTAASQPVRSVLLAFLFGFAFIVLAPVLAIILMVTVVGVAAGLALLLAWVLSMFVAFVLASYYVGGLILQKRATNAVLVGLTGALALGLALIIPLLNVLAALAALFVGTGMMLMHLRYQFSKRPYHIKA